MKKTDKMAIYQAVVIICAAIAIALVPSLLTFTLHILTISPAVIIGLVCCYGFAVAALRAGFSFLIRTVPEKEAEGREKLAH